jgi:site-specific DNA-methyltransferase (adenine-specific)
MSFILYNDDCLNAMRRLEDNSVDSIVTDPPYGLSFMGKKWDYDVPSVEIWAECLRVLKPGGHLLAFAGTRTQHRMAVRIEDAGFEIRDMIAWVYGSGFPKSHNLKDEWQGWGTALKPALEPITIARKPLIGTVADNVLTHGTGGLNIDGCRVATEDKLSGGHASGGQQMTGGWERPWMKDPAAVAANAERSRQSVAKAEELGRWPANLIHDGSDEVVGLFPITNGVTGMTKHASGTNAVYGDYSRTDKSLGGSGTPDKGSAARFFYCAKASKCDRDEGLEGFEAKATAFGNQAQAELKRGNLDHDDGKSGMNKVKMRQNSHPTVKPTDLMRYLCRLVTPPGGVVLDPFMGSGSTGKAAMLEGFQFIGCEMSPEYMEIAKARIEAAIPKDLFA